MGLFLVLAVIFAYQPVWHAGFIWDDDVYVTNNPLLTTPDGLKRIWFSMDSPSQYFPLTYTVFLVEHALWGFNPAGYHWVNILLHAVNSLLLWQLLKRLGVPGAWLAAAIFALHPVQVESVAWITELKNVLSLFFVLLTLLCWVEFVEERVKQSWRWYALALFFCALALFSKTTACTLPAALLLILWLKEKRIGWQRLGQIVPFLAMGVGMGVLTMWWERVHQGTQGKLFSLGLSERILVASHAIWFYAGNLLWPCDLTFSYPKWTINPADPFAYGWLVAGIGLWVAIYFARRLAGRSVEVATLFYVATLSPLLGFIMLYTFRYTFVADHYQYAASIGLIALASAGIARIFAGKLFLKVMCCVALLLTLGILTWRQCGMYSSLETLWRTTIQKNPHAWMAYNNLGGVLIRDGRMDEAITLYQKALEANPNDAEGQNDLGYAFLRKGQADEAVIHSQKALEIDPGDAKAYNNLGLAFCQLGRLDEAIKDYKKSLEIEPKNYVVYDNLGLALFRSGQMDEAIVNCQKALIINPKDTQACNNLGFAFYQRGQTNEAINSFQKSLEIKPDEAIYGDLGLVLSQTGRTSEAIDCYKKGLALNPNDAEIRFNYANALFQQGQVDEAIIHYYKALAINPNDVRFYNNLSFALFKKGRVNEAIISAQRALRLANEQSNAPLAAAIQGQLKLYQTNAVGSGDFR